MRRSLFILAALLSLITTVLADSPPSTIAATPLLSTLHGSRCASASLPKTSATSGPAARAMDETRVDASRSEPLNADEDPRRPIPEPTSSPNGSSRGASAPSAAPACHGYPLFRSHLPLAPPPCDAPLSRAGAPRAPRNLPLCVKLHTISRHSGSENGWHPSERF